MSLVSASLVPGLPHILQPEMNPAYASLAGAMQGLGDRLQARGVERILYYSTGWISVLGQSFQARAGLRGLHVDENWYDLGDLQFAFDVDTDLASRLAAAAEGAGYQSRLIDYEGFPVDTGTIVADRMLNKGRFKTAMVSCCVYSDYAATAKLAGVLAKAAAVDRIPTALVTVSMLSGRFFTGGIDLREDHISDAGDDRWNHRMLDLLAAGKFAEAEALVPEYSQACKVDMGFKALAFLKGWGALAPGAKATVHAYGGIYGTGAAVVEL